MGLYVGIGPPYHVSAAIPASVDFNTLAPTSTTLEITKPKGAKVSWATVVVTQTAALLHVKHVLATSDLDEPGVWRAYAVSVIPGGILRTEVGSFTVHAADQIGT